LDIEKPQRQTIDGTSLLQLDRLDFLHHGCDSHRGVITTAVIAVYKLQLQVICQAKNKRRFS
jgi:hypothetical protein